MEKVNLFQKFSMFNEYWSPKIVGDLNDSHVKVAKLKGQFDWHHHKDEDELFWIVKGRLLIRFRDKDVWLEPGEFIIIPKGVDHLPVADEEVHAVLIEPKGTLNTGNVVTAKTKETLERI
ncbi:MAG TPA: cupin domain-containing protein [Negativicutes bacterium]|nr:cupin domain-containing protein [Negativicutes bacterium]